MTDHAKTLGPLPTGRELREWLWVNHGHALAALYHDDGEMQCSLCRADFKRDNMTRLLLIGLEFQRARVAALTQQLADLADARRSTIVEILGHDGKTVAAPCAISGCQYADPDGVFALRQQLSAQAEELQRVREQAARLTKDLAITSLAAPLMEDLSVRIDEMCRYLAMGQGYTLNGIGQLLVECQKRIANDWVEFGNVRREREHAKADLQRLTEAQRTTRREAFTAGFLAVMCASTDGTTRAWAFDGPAAADLEPGAYAAWEAARDRPASAGETT